MTRFIIKGFNLVICAFFFGCGPTQLGASVNDPVPAGTIVAQAAFNGVNGKTASGSAIIYSASQGSYILRLSGVSLPEENGLQLIVVVNSVAQAPLTLRAPSGSQNYNFSYSGSDPVFNQVRLYSVFAFKDYAMALFTH